MGTFRFAIDNQCKCSEPILHHCLYPLILTNSTVETIAADYYVAARAGWDAGSPNFYEPGGDEYDTWSTIHSPILGARSGTILISIIGVE